MSSEWYYLRNEKECGPIAYRELIQLVRKGTVQEDDLVRPEFLAEWQQADSVVGLFYMARKLDAEDSQAEAPAEQDDATEKESVATTSSSRWWTRLSWIFPVLSRRSASPTSSFSLPTARTDDSEIEHEPVDHRASAFSVPTSETLATHHNAPEQRREDASAEVKSTDETVETGEADPSASDEWTTTVADALQAAQARDAALAREKDRSESRTRVKGSVYAVLTWLVRAVASPVVFLFGWITRTGSTRGRDQVASGLAVLERWLPHPAILRAGFKLGAAVIAANLATFGVLRWSDRQALRFPESESDAGRTFPLIGECGPAEFGFLVFQLALLAGIAAYGVAAVLEANADD